MKNLRYRLDSMIVLFFMMVIVLAGSSFAYKYFTIEECPAIAFDVSQETIEVGQMVMFANKTSGASQVAWDFGDNSKIIPDFHSAHTYHEPGEYTIKLTVNDRCSELRRIVVLPKKNLIDDSLVPRFSGPSTIEINKSVRFQCLTQEAESYEWRFGETGKVDSKKRNPVYKFNTPGLKTISLVINGNEKYIAKETVHVLTPTVRSPKKEVSKAPANFKKEAHIPEAPTDWSMFEDMKPEPVEAPAEKLKALKNDELMVAIKEYSQGVFKLAQFRPSFCNKVENSLVEANGKLMKFPDFLAAIKGHNLRVKEFRTIRGEEGCVMQVIIRYRK